MCIYHLVQKEKNQRPKFKGRNVQGKYDFTKFTKKNIGLSLFKNVKWENFAQGDVHISFGGKI